MFRKLTERISSAASSVLGVVNNEENEKVQRLTALGFDSNMAMQALQATQGNVDQAAELLLSQQQAQARNTPAPPPSRHQQQQQQRPTTAAQEEEQLQRAMQESYDLAAARSKKPTPPPTRTAAMHKAAEAAARRAAGESSSNPIDVDAAPPPPALKNNNSKQKRAPTIGGGGGGGLAVHHPDVKIIPKLQDKSKEEQIMRCANRLKTFPAAVDTILRALVAVQKEPNNIKFRTIDKTSIGYQRSLANVPGAQDMLLAMNYRHASQKSHHDTLLLDLARIDPALLYLGISALEQIQLTSMEYKQGKRRIEFSKQMTYIRGLADSDTQEALRRAAFLSKCPSEPLEGRGAWMQVILGDGTSGGSSAGTTTITPPSSGGLPLVKKSSFGNNNTNTSSTMTTTNTTNATIETLRRRFDGDDTLQDVLYWLGAHGTQILEKLTTREWILRDLHRGGHPLTAMDITKQAAYTLQYIGCWPSGKLDIVPNDEYYNNNDNKEEGSSSTTTTTANHQAGSIRGLGAAPKDAL